MPSLPGAVRRRLRLRPMSSTSGRRRPLALFALLLAAFLLAPVSSASAHAELKSSDPADGSTITELPSQVSLTFGEDLMAEGNGLTAHSVTSGRDVDLTAVVDGDTISADWPEGTPSGQYQVDYRVVSADGHPVEGEITFTITLPVGGATVTVGPAPTSAAASPTESPSTSPAEESGDDGSNLLAWILGFGVVVVVGAASGTWIMRRANRM